MHEWANVSRARGDGLTFPRLDYLLVSLRPDWNQQNSAHFHLGKEVLRHLLRRCSDMYGVIRSLVV